ncbi:MAG TPA: hypothetical protein VLA98_13090 [Solirubrobacteraceae bacterium]|nr:hypothetical protein [Solirubrobacteraceae bacterium]
MDRPPGIYASTASRRDLARRRARRRPPLAVRSGNWAAAASLAALVAAVVQRVAG